MKVCKITAAALTCATVLAVTAAAQTAPLLSVSRVQVKPGSVGEYLDIEKQIAEYRKKAGAPMRRIYRASVGNPFEFMVVIVLDNYAALDTDPAWLKDVPEGKRTILMARRSQCIERVQTSFERGIPELSLGTMQDPAPKIVRTVRTRVRPGKAGEYMDLVKNELIPAYKKVGLTWLRTRRVEWGGTRNEFVSAFPVENMAALDGPMLIEKALGAEGAKKYQEKVAALITYSEYGLYRFQEELSNEAPAK
jgi:hypothetical protein